MGGCNSGARTPIFCLNFFWRIFKMTKIFRNFSFFYFMISPPNRQFLAYLQKKIFPFKILWTCKFFSYKNIFFSSGHVQASGCCIPIWSKFSQLVCTLRLRCFWNFHFLLAMFRVTVTSFWRFQDRTIIAFFKLWKFILSLPVNRTSSNLGEWSALWPST